jgi:MSHA biogenesis protein MshJ
MRTINLKEFERWMTRFDRMNLGQRAGLVAATAAVLYAILSLALVGQTESGNKARKQRIETQRKQLDATRKEIRELTAALEHDPNAPQLVQLDGMKRTIAEADTLLTQLEFDSPRTAGLALREVLGATPGLEVGMVRTLAPAVAFTSQATPKIPAKSAPGAKDAAPKPLRVIYRNGIEASITGNYLALLPYLEKLQKHPARLYWNDLSLNVQDYPIAVLRLNVHTLDLQANPGFK